MGRSPATRPKSKKTVPILEIAEFVIAYFKINGDPIDQLKLQKILYYIQAWHLANFGTPLFEEEPEAWVNGPVYRSVYNKYKRFKDRPIQLSIENIETVLQEKKMKLKLSKNTEKLIEEVLRIYGKMDTFGLVYLTHLDQPWTDARKGLKPFDASSNKITFDSMMLYYKKLLKERTDK